MSPEPFLFSPLTSPFFRLSFSFLSGIPHSMWMGIREDGGGLGTLQNFIIDYVFCGIFGQVLICWVLSVLKNEHHYILNTVMPSFLWNWAKPGKRWTEKIITPLSILALHSTAWQVWSPRALIHIFSEEWECPLWPKRQQIGHCSPPKSRPAPRLSTHSIHTVLSTRERRLIYFSTWVQ